MEQKTNRIEHNLELKNKTDLKISGVTEVLFATPSQIECKTEFGPLLINGADLKVQSLNQDEKYLIACGDISKIEYTKSKKGFINKLFK